MGHSRTLWWWLEMGPWIFLGALEWEPLFLDFSYPQASHTQGLCAVNTQPGSRLLCGCWDDLGSRIPTQDYRILAQTAHAGKPQVTTPRPPLGWCTGGSGELRLGPLRSCHLPRPFCQAQPLLSLRQQVASEVSGFSPG